MTDKEKEAIQTFEFFLDDISKNGGCTIDIDFQHKKEYEAMWKIVNLIKNQQKEIEQSNKVIDKRNEEKIELVEMCLKKDKIIDLTIAFISTRYKEDEDINNFAKEVMERGEWTNLNKILKEYFTKKVEEEQ